MDSWRDAFSDKKVESRFSGCRGTGVLTYLAFQSYSRDAIALVNRKCFLFSIRAGLASLRDEDKGSFRVGRCRWHSRTWRLKLIQAPVSTSKLTAVLS